MKPQVKKPIKKARKIIKIGDKFGEGELEVTGKESSSKGHTRWEVTCPKKHKFTVFDRNLKTGATKHCPTCQEGAIPEDVHALLWHHNDKSPYLLPLRWTSAGEFDQNTTRGHLLCLRGASFVAISLADYHRGRRPSAGTRSKTRSAKPRSEAYKRTYHSWYDMKRRIDDPKHPYYADYGGRGIRYDNLWQYFDIFLMQMGEAPEGLTLDRANYNGHYHMGNCNWKTPEEQAAPGARRPRKDKVNHPVVPFEGEYAMAPDPRLTFIPDNPDGISI